MKCPSCQFENKEDANFCLECGERLELKCSQCGRTLPIGAKFCDKCGNNFKAAKETPPKELSFDEKIGMKRLTPL
jgi:hypothetical protein